MTRHHEITTPEELQEDISSELSLRPQRLAISSVLSLAM